MTHELILAGSVHLDTKLKNNIYSTLQAIRPELLTVEISRFSVIYRSFFQHEWLDRYHEILKKLPEEKKTHSNLKLLELQLKMPFEWEVAEKYCRNEGIICLPVDTGDLARKELPVWKRELLTFKNVQNLVSTPDFDLNDHFDSCCLQAGNVIEGKENFSEFHHPLAWLADAYWAKREKILAVRIRRLLRKYSPVVHLGGWMHIVTGSPWKTMSDMLIDLNPERIMLFKDT
ncbi:MAG TPA: hypothetical protein EYP57_04035 [Thermodesulfobacteriaceae bacterium]|nr:hypothetical protein [Thermodesulfobacteriaceae bacterium]